MCLIFVAGLWLAATGEAGAQSSRPRRATTKQKGAAKPKPQPKPKPKPLTAKDHRAAEQQLADLGYWTGAVDGRWDDASRHALIAFQKVEGLKRTGQLTRADYEVVMAATRPAPREAGAAHVEVDLIRQVLFIVDDAGTVARILPVSTGNGKDFTSQGWTRAAITPPGRFNITGKIAGWKKSPLGRLYYPNYFLGGMAIHGYPSVPANPASHGCIRIPMFAAKPFSREVPVGISLIVHNGVTPEVLTAGPGATLR